jgi:serine phosphatase RsbU (regulator of sigma subunit)/putative methionine-R-sulfoxide reductase with GAF domain
MRSTNPLFTLLQPAAQPLSAWIIGLLIALAATLAALLILFMFYLRRRQNRKELELRIVELERLEQASRAIVASELDLAALCRLIANEAGHVIDTGTFQIGVFDKDLYQILFWRINDEEQEVPVTYELRDSVGIVGWVRETKTPKLIEDLHVEIARLPEEPHYVSRHPGRSAIYLPLISGEMVIGVMAAQHDEPHQFSQQDLRRLAILANQAAAAIDNASLYEQAHTRAEDLEMVSWISQQVNEIQDMADILDQVVTLTRDRLGFHPINVMGIDPETNESVLQATTIPTLSAGSVRLPYGEGVIGAAARELRTIVINDVDTDDRYVSHTGFALLDGEAMETRSEIAIPLMTEDRLVGVMDVQSSRVGGFSQREQAVLEAVANTATAALQKADQLNQQREQAWIATVQLQVADAINVSRSLPELLEAVARLTTLLVGTQSAALLQWDEEVHCYLPGAIFGVDEPEEHRFFQTHLAIGDWHPLDAAHIGLDVMRTPKLPPWLDSAENSKFTLRPLLIPEGLLGMLITQAESEESRQHSGYVFDTEHARQSELLSSIAEQTARAIERDALRTAQQEEAWVNTALLQVADAVNSLFDLNEILGTIVRLVPMLVGVKASVLLTWDDEEARYRVGPSYGISKKARDLLDSGVDMSRLVVEEHEVAMPAEAKVYSIRVPEQLRIVFETDSAEFIPLYARGQLVGGLVVGASRNGRALTGRRLNILTGIAQQAALAVVNDRLYKQSAEQERLQQEIAVARNIQTSLIPKDSPNIPGLDVAGYWGAARQVSGDFYDFLALPNGSWGILIADVADKGIPAALFMALCRTIIRSVGFTRLEPSATLSRANDIIVNDTESDLFVTVFYAVWDPETRTLHYANGGHNPPLFIRKSGSTELLNADGIAMGIIEGMEFEEKAIQLHSGDTLIMYTDGVNETMDSQLNEFGLERLQDVVTEACGQSADAIVTAITTALDDFAGDEPQFDDTTLVVINCT